MGIGILRVNGVLVLAGSIAPGLLRGMNRTRSGILLQTGAIVKLFVEWHRPLACGKKWFSEDSTTGWKPVPLFIWDSRHPDAPPKGVKYSRANERSFTNSG